MFNSSTFDIYQSKDYSLNYGFNNRIKSMFDMNIYHDYKRMDFHKFYSSDKVFYPGAGKWGGSGIVNIPDSNDFVFFVTYNSKQSGHSFKEGIDINGVFNWQSQPQQSLNSKQIKNFISHDESNNNIFLLIRENNTTPYYTYLGKLKYLSHDLNKTKPVWFKWQILDWNPPNSVVNKFVIKNNLKVNKTKQIKEKEIQSFNLRKYFRKLFIERRTQYRENKIRKSTDNENNNLIKILKNNVNLFNLREGYRVEYNYELINNDYAPMVCFGPQNKFKVVSHAMGHDRDVLQRAISLKIYALLIILEKDYSDENIDELILVVSKNFNGTETIKFCRNFHINMIKVEV